MSYLDGCLKLGVSGMDSTCLLYTSDRCGEVEDLVPIRLTVPVEKHDLDLDTVVHCPIAHDRAQNRR